MLIAKRLMRKILKNKVICVIFLVICIICYIYIMVLKAPNFWTVTGLIGFTMIMRILVFNMSKKYKQIKIVDYIYPIVVTLLLFFGMNR